MEFSRLRHARCGQLAFPMSEASTYPYISRSDNDLECHELNVRSNEDSTEYI